MESPPRWARGYHPLLAARAVSGEVLHAQARKALLHDLEPREAGLAFALGEDGLFDQDALSLGE